MESTLRKIGDPLFFVFMIGAIIPIFIFESEFNEPYNLAFKYLSLPILILTFLLSKLLLPKWRSEVGPFKANGFTLLSALLFILLSGGYVIAFNALIGKQTPIMIEGSVTNKSKTIGSKSTSYQISINDKNSGKEIKVESTEKEYKNTEVGDTYSKKWVVGSLGLIYKI